MATSLAVTAGLRCGSTITPVASPIARRHRGREGQPHERVGDLRLRAARHAAVLAVRVPRLVAGGHQDVLDGPQRVEAGLLGGGGQGARAVTSGEEGVGVDQPEAHAPDPTSVIRDAAGARRVRAYRPSPPTVSSPAPAVRRPGTRSVAKAAATAAAIRSPPSHRGRSSEPEVEAGAVPGAAAVVGGAGVDGLPAVVIGGAETAGVGNRGVATLPGARAGGGVIADPPLLPLDGIVGGGGVDVDGSVPPRRRHRRLVEHEPERRSAHRVRTVRDLARHEHDIDGRASHRAR